ncbi:MAG: IPT/TIG domain-containing protein [Actinomycetota bacterium]
MRRTDPFVRPLVVTLVVAGLTTAGTAGAGATAHRQAATATRVTQRGTAVTGLQLAGRGSPCADVGFEIRIGGKVQGCTHGPDPAPAGVDPTAPRSLSDLRASTGVSETGRTVPCVGDGTTGNRVQAVYAHLSTKPDHFSTVAPLIRTWAAQANEAFNASAAETQGSRQIRFVTKSCVLSVLDKSVPANSASNFGAEITALANGGLKATNRKYLIWTDATSYCGLGEVFANTSSSTSNRNNKGPQYASVEKDCWGQLGNPRSTGPSSVEAHELTHALGAVQANSPHHTSAGHCTDEWEAMCYVDAGSTHLQFTCPIQHSAFLDCGHNDYFSTNPPANSYLATHWNTAKNSFLVANVAPGNDALSRATPLPATAGIYVDSNRLATAETNEPNTAGSNASHSIWYSLKATADRQLTVDTQGTPFDTVLGVYTGSAVGSLTSLDQSDDVPSFTYSRATGGVVAGTTYFIKVDGKAGAVGQVILHVSLTQAAFAPLITNISPPSAAKGSVLTITGSGFGGFFFVEVDGFPAAVTGSPIATQIQVTVPSSVNDPGPNSINVGAKGPVIFVSSDTASGPATSIAISDQSFTYTT